MDYSKEMGESATPGRTEKKVLRLRHISAASLLLIALSVAGCANPGPPRPPSLQLPEIVTDLSASRVGDRVRLRWTTPSQTTDKLDIKAEVRAEICREVGTVKPIAKKYSGTKPTSLACVPVETVQTTPGTASVWDDLPATLVMAPAQLLTYRVQLLNAAGRSAGASMAAYTAGGTAPSPVSALTATASKAGGVLQWQDPSREDGLSVELFRTDLSAPSAPAEKGSAAAKLPVFRGKGFDSAKKDKGQSAPVVLRAPAFGPDLKVGGTVDTTAAMGRTYSYTAQQVKLVTIDGRSLELRSEPSAPVLLAMRDTFPPSSPTGLVTIPGMSEASGGKAAAPYIDLSWEPNTEPDLTGYLVYRQLARPNGDPEGQIVKLTSSPVTAPAFRDVTVVPGQRYSYLVTAVDASGNESAPSARAQEIAGIPDPAP